MKLSKRGEYALRVLIRLCRERAAGRETMSIRSLAEAERIPRSFLEQILLQLKHGGYVSSRRGLAGGYRLARPASRVRVGEIIRYIDGTVAPVGCVSRIAYAPCTCPEESTCGLRRLMGEVRAAIIEVLDRRTLAEVALDIPPGGSMRRGRAA